MATEHPEPSGVRSEHDLRQLLKDSEQSRARLKRVAEEAQRYVYGPRESNDLTRLRQVLRDVGYPAPKRDDQSDA